MTARHIPTLRERTTSWQYLLLAFAMAASLWFMVSGRGEVEAWVRMPLEMTGMPSDLVIVNGMTPDIEVRVRAPKGLVRGLSEKMPAYPLELSSLKAGPNVIPVQPSRIPLGGAYEVMEIRPTRLTLKVDKLITKQVPAVPEWSGELATDMTVERTSVRPEVITLTGPKERLDLVHQVPVLIPTPQQDEPGVVEAKGAIALPDGLEAEPAEVDVMLVLGLKTQTVTLQRSVTVAAPDSVTVRGVPRKVALEVEVPESAAENTEFLNSITAVLEIPPAIEAGSHTLRYRISLPEQVWLKTATPAALDVTIRRK